jgi:hypothetical protein
MLFIIVILGLTALKIAPHVHRRITVQRLRHKPINKQILSSDHQIKNLKSDLSSIKKQLKKYR